MDPRPSRRADVKGSVPQMVIRLVSMDPRPSRRADDCMTVCQLLGGTWSQWILGRVVALTVVCIVLPCYCGVSMDPRPSRRADKLAAEINASPVKSQWILGRVVALTRWTGSQRSREMCLNGSSAESSR